MIGGLGSALNKIMQRFSIEEEDVFFDSLDKTPIASSPLCSVADEDEDLEVRKLDSRFWRKDG